MPIYEFVCESCGRLVERLQKLSDPPPEECPECGGKMAKIMSRNSFQLKGGGWYRDLYSSGGGEAKNGASSSAAPEKKEKKETKETKETKVEKVEKVEKADKPAETAKPAASDSKSD